MKRTAIITIYVLAVSLLSISCANEEILNTNNGTLDTHTIFNITVMHNTRTKGVPTKFAYDAEMINSSLDSDVALSLVGSDKEKGTVLVDNIPVFEKNGVRMADIHTSIFSSGYMVANAFYPYVSSVSYREDGSCAVSFTPNDIQRGPLASQEVIIRNDQEFETVNLKFHHIANNLGFKICDITGDDELKGLIHIRKVVLHGMPTEGLYVCNGDDWQWVPNARRQKIVIFEGDEYLKVGAENALYLGNDKLTENNSECNRNFVVPEELTEGKHYLEVVFDVDPFDYDGSHYGAIANRTNIIPLSGVIPDNMFELGLQYTFTVGINLNTVYKAVQFSATVQDWEENYDSRVLDFDNE